MRGLILFVLLLIIITIVRGDEWFESPGQYIDCYSVLGYYYYIYI